MESRKDIYLQEDIEYIANSNLPYEEFYNSRILISGATGLIGSQIVKALLCMNRIRNANITILALVRNTEKANKIFSDVIGNEKLKFINMDIIKPLGIEEPVDYIIHTASNTTSKFFVDKPVETIDISVNGTMNILNLAKDKGVKGAVYLSSMEVFGVTDARVESVKEENLGYIDIHNVRSSYSESKRLCECICSSFASEYNLPIRIARLAQTFGAGISWEENRVFAQFAKSAINGSDIVLHTYGNSVGNYCYTRDAVMAILLLLIRGNSGEAYTIANEESNITIREMAQMVADRIANGKIKVVFDVPESMLTYGYAPDVKMKLNSSKMKSLGWNPEIGLEESYIRMIRSMKVGEMSNG